MCIIISQEWPSLVYFKAFGLQMAQQQLIQESGMKAQYGLNIIPQQYLVIRLLLICKQGYSTSFRIRCFVVIIVSGTSHYCSKK